MTPPLTVERLSFTWPNSRPALSHCNLQIPRPGLWMLVGTNGSGKSTLLRIMAGNDQEHLGETILSKGYTRGMLEQEPALDPEKTVKQVVEEAVQPLVDMLAQFDAVSARFAEPDADFDALLAEQSQLQDQLDRQDAWTLDARLETAMDALRCPAGDMQVKVLSGGERRRVALCRLLLTEPDILLLDEPTNHLDAESVAWLERHLQQYKGTVIAVTHDRYFLDNVAGWILELDRGYGIPWKGNYSSWLEQKQARLATEESGEVRRQKTLQRELEWIRMSPKARQSKGKARITAYERLLGEDYEKQREDLQIYLPPGPRLGGVVFEVKQLRKAVGDKLLIENLSLSIPPGSLVGVIGGNGAGKTTLLRMLAGLDQPDAGTVTVGQTVALGYVEQMRDALNGEKTVWEEISGGNDNITLGKRKLNSRAYVAGFNFLGTDQQKKVGMLSGGERNRVQLAKVLMHGANVLLLDEPSNDLDVNTMRALEEALENFAGCAIIVSHDRWFLDRVATHMLVFEGDSQLRWFEGGYSDYEADRRKRLGQAADVPHRVKYRPLAR